MSDPHILDPEAAASAATSEFEVELVDNLMVAFADSDLANAAAYRLRKRAGRQVPLKITRTRTGPKERDPKSYIPTKAMKALVQVAVRNTFVHGATLPVIDPEILKIAELIQRTLPDVRKQRSEGTIEKLVDALVDTHDPIARVSAEIDAENAKARLRFVQNIATLTSEEIAKAAGHEAKNKSQTASRWKSEQRIFSTPFRGQEVYPAFQFKEGRPLPIVKEVLKALPGDMSPWETAFWFVSGNSWLDGKAPTDLLVDRDRVIEAARREAEAVIG